MTSKEINTIIHFVDNKLPKEEMPQLEQIITDHPDALNAIHEMARLRRVIGTGQDLETYLGGQKQNLFDKIASEAPI